jgi:hypothetical protein
MRASKMRWVRGALRGLQDPVRTLAQAVADITANLEGEFDAPATSHLRRAEIAERLALLRAALTGHGCPATLPTGEAFLEGEGSAA